MISPQRGRSRLGQKSAQASTEPQPFLTRLFSAHAFQSQQRLLTVLTVLGPRQCDRDGVRIRALGVLGYAEDNLNDLGVNVDSLHERPDDFPPSLPVRACQLWPNGVASSRSRVVASRR